MAVEIYSKEGCGYCQQAKALFREHGVAFIEHDVSTPAAFAEMQKRIAGANSVPQILIDGQLVGGFEVLNLFWEEIRQKL